MVVVYSVQLHIMHLIAGMVSKNAGSSARQLHSSSMRVSIANVGLAHAEQTNQANVTLPHNVTLRVAHYII